MEYSDSMIDQKKLRAELDALAKRKNARDKNYKCCSENVIRKLTELGYHWYVFDRITNNYTINDEYSAIQVVKQLRKQNYFARILRGFDNKNQHNGKFSVVYRKNPNPLHRIFSENEFFHNVMNYTAFKINKK